MRRKDQERLEQLQSEFQSKDEAEQCYDEYENGELEEDDEDDEEEDLEDEEEELEDEDEDDDDEDDEEEEEEEELATKEFEEADQSLEEPMAGEATPLSMPSSELVSSPEETSKASIEVFELDESSSESISPDMESKAMFVKLKELQYKNAVAEAELAKLKAKMILLENAEGQKKHYEKKCEEMAQRLLEKEKSLDNSRKEINHYQDLMEGSQGQYIALEKKMHADYSVLEKKYHKAKKLIKEFQQREKDFIQERESLLQQQNERDQQYNALVKSLKDRIFQLEHDLAETQKAAGLPVLIPRDSISPNQRIEKPTIALGTGRTLPKSPEAELADSQVLMVKSGAKPQDLNVVSETEPLDSSTNQTIASLVVRTSSLAKRSPNKSKKNEGESDHEVVDEEEDHPENDSGLETWIKHDSRDSHSDTSSSVSQTSYDPSKPVFKELGSEIPEGPNACTDTTDSSESQISKGVTLVSNKPLPTEKGSTSHETLSSSYMVSEPNDEAKSNKYSFNISPSPAHAEDNATNRRINQYQSCPINEWNTEHVNQWLLSLEMDKYSQSFTDKLIGGKELLLIDGAKLKALGVNSSNDRTMIKKKIKELKSAMEKERKQMEKERKAKEKEQKKLLKKK